MVDSVTDVIINYKSENLDQTVNGVQRTSAALDGLVVASSSTEKSVASLENRFKSLERQFGTTAGQATQFEKIQKQVDQAVANDPSLKERGDDIKAAAAAKYNLVLRDSLVAENNLGEAHNKLSTQGQALAHAIRSTVTEFSLGVPPTQILTQQFSHLTFAATGEGGLSGAFSNVASVFGKMISPMTATIAITAAAAAGALALANAYDKVQVSSQRALIGAGDRTGTTISDLNNFTQQNSTSGFGSSGTSLSNKEARTLGEDLTKTGDIVVSQLHNMSDAVVGFANQTGKSIADASKDFVAFGKDPKKALQELAGVFGDFDVATRKAVEELVRADDKTGAYNVILDALAEKSKAAAENMTAAAQAGRLLGNVLASETTKPKGLEGQLAGAQANVASAQGALSDAGRQGAPSPVLEALAENLAKARKEVEQFQGAMDKVNAQKAASEINKLSTEADNAVRSIVPQIAELEQLKDKLAELERAKAAGTTSRYGAEVDNAARTKLQNEIAATQQLQAESARYQQRVAEISVSWGNVGQSTALALQSLQNSLPVAQAWTESGRLRAQYQATYNELLDKGKTAEEASAVAAKQYEVSKAAAVASAQKLVQSSQDQVDLALAAGTAGEAQAKSSIAYRDAMQAGATSSQAAAISANVMAASLIQSASSANSMADAEERAQRARVAANDGGDFGNFQTTHEGNSAVTTPLAVVQYFASMPTSSQQITNALSRSSSIDAQITALKNTRTLEGTIPGQSASGGFVTAGTTYADIGVHQSAAQIASAVLSLYDLKIQQAGNDPTAKRNATNEEITYLQSRPQTIETLSKITSLKQSLETLTTSTNNLNSTNQELLSPYYTQDPRTSHIGFRSQGMASGGEFTVPGGYSANDNMLAQIPVASGEIVSVRRPGQGGGGSAPVYITNHIIVGNRADRNEIGRTVYQSTQNATRQLRSVS